MKSVLTLLVTILLLVAPTSLYALKISEIMYNPEGADSKAEWVEVFNDGDSLVDLSEYFLLENQINHGITHHSGPVELSVGGYAVIAADAASLRSSLSSNVALYDSVFTLNNTGETISLLDPNKSTIDSVSYSDRLGASGDGNSLNRIENSLQPRIPTPGDGPSTEVARANGSQSGTSANSLTPYVFPQKTSAFNLMHLPKSGIADQPIDFSLENKLSRKQSAYWYFNDGTEFRDRHVVKTFPFPGQYTYEVKIKEGGDLLLAEKITLNIEEPNLKITTGYYKEEQYLRLTNQNGSRLNVSNWQVKIGQKDYELPNNLVLEPQDSYAFHLEGELNYPIVILNESQEIITRVSARSSTNDTESSSATKPVVARALPSNNITSQPDHQSEQEFMEDQARLREIFESYDEQLITGTVSAPSDIIEASSDHQLVANVANSNSDTFNPIRTIINVLMILLLGVGLAMLLSSKKLITRNMRNENNSELDAADYEIISDDEADF